MGDLMRRREIIRCIFVLWFVLILVSNRLVSHFRLEYDADTMWWVFALISSPAWFGAETAMGWGLSDGLQYFLGLVSAIITLGLLYALAIFIFVRKPNGSQ